jgi:hypothetical protein
MQCQGFTKSGKPCRNQATANGYCHLHIGVPTRQARRREFERNYSAMTPEERSSHDSVVTGCILVILALALLYGAITGDWSGVGKWLSR